MQKSRRQDIVLLGVVGVGIALRLRQFFFARSLWLDEATFANGILDNGFLYLVTQEHQFVDPVGYILLTKVGVAVFGQTEYAFRWIALVAGIASVVLAALLARRLFETFLAQVTFTGFLALAPVLIYYSNEAQQYALDVMAVLLVLWVFVSFADWRRGFTYLVLIGVLLPWFSYSSAVVLFGVGVALAVRWLRSRSYKKIVIVGAAWGLSSLAALVHARMITRSDFLEDYWTSGFAPFPISSWSDLRWFPESAAKVVEMAWFADGFVPRDPPAASLWSWLILGLVVIGAALLARRRPWVALSVGTVFVAAFLVSALGLYPFGSRPGLYMVPLVFLLATEPIDWAMRRRSLMWRVPSALIAVALIVVLAVPSFRFFVSPESPSDIKGALSYVVENREPDDWVIVHGWSSRAFWFYEPQYELGQVTIEVSRDFDVPTFLLEIGPVPEPGRVWLVFSHRLREAEQFVEELGQVVPILEQSEDGSYLVALVDLSSVP